MIAPRAAAILSAALGLTLLGSPLPARAQQRQLQRAMSRVAAAWARGDAAGVVGLAARTGLSLDMRDGAVGPLAPRQAVAMLRRVFGRFQTVSAHAGQAEVTGGRPARGYGEITWVVRNRGSTTPQLARVFVALVHENGQWRVTQIRLMP